MSLISWTSPRTWVSGEVVTAALMNTHVRDNLNDLADGSWGVDRAFVLKPSNESVVATTTVQSDDHLLFSVSANAIYIVSLCLFLEANNLNDAKFGWSLPASATFNMLKDTPSTSIAGGTTAGDGDWAAVTGGTTNTLNVGVTDGSITIGVELRALINTAGTAGTATLQWAQVVSGSTLTVKSGSWLRAERVA